MLAKKGLLPSARSRQAQVEHGEALRRTA
jgi:hypothetical protein